MWIVRLALRRPYTFVVLALLIFIAGPLALLRTPTDIFPNIDIPVVSIVWSYNGFSAEDMAKRITSNYERALTSDVDDIEHIESQSLNGVSVVKVFFHPGADINRAIAQAASNAASILRILPPGTLPPNIITYNASTVPILQLGLSSDTLAEQQLYDLGNSFIRTQLATVQGAAVPLPFGGKIRQIVVDLDTRALQAKGLAPIDVVNAINAQNLILPGGTAKIGTHEYNVQMNGSTQTVAALNDLPVKTIGGNVVYVRDVAHVRDGYAPQTNIVRVDGKRAALLTVEKTGSASTLTIIDQVKAMLPKIAAGLPNTLRIAPLDDQSVFVKAAVQGVVREALIAACLTALMILLFLGSWRATLIIAITIPLAVLTSLLALSVLGQTINIMTLGGLALAVGILVDDATVAIENITHHLELGAPLEEAILTGAGEIAVPTFVSTLSICIVFVPMFLLTGVARYLFVPLAEAVIFAMIASYFFSRTLVPTLAMALMRAKGSGRPPRGAFARIARFQAAFEHRFEAVRLRYRALLSAAIARRRRFAAAFLLACVASTGLYAFAGQDFFPSVDTGEIRLHLRAPTGTRIEETARLTDEVEAKIRSVIPANQLAGVLDNIGVPVSGINLTYDSSDPIGTEDADVLVTLKPDHASTAAYVAKLRNVLAQAFPGVTFAFLPADIVSQILNFGLPAPIDIQIVGNKLDQNRAVANALLAKLRGVRGLVDARIQQPGDEPAINVNVDRTKAIQAGLDQRDVAQNLLIALSGSSQTTPNFWLDPRNGVSYPVLVQTPQYTVNSLQSLANVPLPAGTARSPQTPAGGPAAGAPARTAPSRSGRHVLARDAAGRGVALQRAAGARHLRVGAGARPRRRHGRRDPARRRRARATAARRVDRAARPGAGDARVVRGAARRPRARDLAGLPADGRELPVVARSARDRRRAAGIARRHRVDAVRHAHHAVGARADRHDPVHRHRDREQHSRRERSARVARGRRAAMASGARRGLQPLPARRDDRARDADRHVADGTRPRRRRRAERPARPRGDRRPRVRHGVDAAVRAGAVRLRPCVARPASRRRGRPARAARARHAGAALSVNARPFSSFDSPDPG
ncbi:RND transporter, Hydrophobe/Amphiphile Efflux-1 (HAE1)/Heavy Metal Efflux (HME) family, permease protein, partial [Burkholderia cenocepacia BC7]